MKLRIKGNTVRLRLSQDEVSSLAKEGIARDACEIGGNTLHYSIQAGDASKIECSYTPEGIQVIVPKNLVTDWDNDERVGFDERYENGFYILIEKDWQCLKPRPQEDETNLYPNPQAL